MLWKLGIARALLEFNIELRSTLKADGLLTRDARIKERKIGRSEGARSGFPVPKRCLRVLIEVLLRMASAIRSK